jgi:hypothetical protein
MKTSCRILPFIPAAALAACGSPTTASVQLDPHDGWQGTAEVLVHKPDGTMASRTPITKDLDVALDDGDTVTIALHDAGKTLLWSSAGVQRGDAIELPIGPLGDGQWVSTTVNLPSVSGATSWELATPNSSASGDVSPSFTIDIPAGKTSVPIIGTAESASGALAMYGEKNAAIDPAGPSVTLADTIPWQAITVTAQNAPAGVNAFVGGDVVLGSDQLGLASIGTSVAVPTSFGDYVALMAGAFAQPEFDLAGSAYSAAPSGAVSFDLSLPELPKISAPTLANGKATWTLTGGGSYTMVGLSLQSSTNNNFSWSIETPPGTASLTLPQLPSDLAAPALDEVSVAALSRSDLGSYADVLHVTAPPPAGSHWSERLVSAAPAGATAPRAHGVLRGLAALPVVTDRVSTR